MEKFYGFIKGAIYIPTKIVYPTKVIGKENLLDKHKKAVTVSNHFAWTDIIQLSINIRGYRRYIAKKEFGNNRFIRFMCKNLGIILVDREKADISAMRTGLKSLKEDMVLSIFPEGTRNKSGTNDIQEIKSGASLFAVKGKAPVQPILFYARGKVFKKNYMYVAPSFILPEFEGLDSSAQLERATEIIAQKMIEGKQYLDDYVENKRWKEIRQNKRNQRRENRFYLKEAKRAFLNANKEIKKQNKINKVKG